MPRMQLDSIATFAYRHYQACLFVAVGVFAPPALGADPSSVIDPAAERSALVEKALAYEHGEGVRKDPQRAIELYCQAARNFDAEAQYRLGWIYANGRGVPRSDELAAGLFASAAALGGLHAAQALQMLGDVSRRMPACMSTPEFSFAITKAEFDRVELVSVDPNPFENLPPWKQKIANAVQSLAPSYAIETRLALAVIAVESNFEWDAVSSKGAAGLMQLIPETAARFNVKSRYDVDQNLRGGLAYLRWLLAYYQGQVPLAAAAYNAGEAAVDKYRGIPPYAETREYVRKVVQLYGQEIHRYDPGVVDPSPVVLRRETHGR